VTQSKFHTQHTGPTDIRRHCKKYNRYIDLATGIIAFFVYSI